MNELINFVDCYFLTKLNTGLWDNMEATDKMKYVAEALRQVKSIDGIVLPEELTDGLKTAISEVCYELINFTDNEQFAKLKQAGVSSISYGNDSVSFSNITTSQTENSYVNSYAFSLLRPYISRSFNVV